MGNAFRSDPDVALMLAVQAGDGAAFEQLVARHGKRLVAFFQRQMGSGDLAEDLAQETFLKVYRARQRYRPTARFTTWLLTIATNLALNTRRYESQRRHLSLDAGAPEGAGGPAAGLAAGEGASAPELASEQGEVAERVRNAVASLPDRQRAAVLLHRFEGLSYRLIGEAMGLTEKAVKSLLNRAKSNLRAALERDIKDYLMDDQGLPARSDLLT